MLALGPLVGLSWAGAFSAFTDSVDVTSQFSTGSVSIQANGQSGTVAFTSLSVDGMTPGTVRYAPLQITNAGTSDFHYVMTAASGGDHDLAAALTIGVKVVPGPTCDASDYADATTVATPQTTGIDDAAIAARPLASGASEQLCFQVSLPAAAGNALQGLTTNATFSFSAEP